MAGELLHAVAEVEQAGAVVFRYATAGGEVIDAANPNGALHAIAGLSNREGNVLAMMPHPERATWLRQVPEDLAGRWGRDRRGAAGESGRMDSAGPGRAFFAALRGAKEGGPR